MERPKSCRAHLGLMAFAMTTTLTLTVTHLEMRKKMPEVFFESLRRETYFVNITLTLEFGDPGLLNTY